MYGNAPIWTGSTPQWNSYPSVWSSQPPPALNEDEDTENVWHYVPAGQQAERQEGKGHDGKSNAQRSPKSDSFRGRVHRNWFGRSTQQVEHDNLLAAFQNPHNQSMAPRDPKPNQYFTVFTRDGEWMRLDHNTIDGAMKGKWQRNPANNELYFVEDPK